MEIMRLRNGSTKVDCRACLLGHDQSHNNSKSMTQEWDHDYLSGTQFLGRDKLSLRDPGLKTNVMVFVLRLCSRITSSVSSRI